MRPGCSNYSRWRAYAKIWKTGGGGPGRQRSRSCWRSWMPSRVTRGPSIRGPSGGGKGPASRRRGRRCGGWRRKVGRGGEGFTRKGAHPWRTWPRPRPYDWLRNNCEDFVSVVYNHTSGRRRAKEDKGLQGGRHTHEDKKLEALCVCRGVIFTCLGNYIFSQVLGIQIMVQNLIILRSNKQASGFQLIAEYIHFLRPKWRPTPKTPEFLDDRHASGKMLKYIRRLEIKSIETWGPAES